MAAYLETEPGANHQLKYKVEVLLDGPQRLHSSISEVDEEVESSGGKDGVGE